MSWVKDTEQGKKKKKKKKKKKSPTINGETSDSITSDNEVDPKATDKITKKKQKRKKKIKTTTITAEEPQSSNTKEKPQLIKLREGVKVTPQELNEANKHLKQLPKNFEWKDSPRITLRNMKWSPNADTDPRNTPNLEGRSLTQIFLDMITEPLQIVRQHTNTFGQKKFKSNWRTLTASLMIAMLSAFFYMDTSPKKNVLDYWRKGRPDKFMARLGLSRRQFHMYLTALRLYDPKEYSEEEKKTNKIYKAEKFIESLCRAFQRMRHPKKKHLSIDEQMALYMGRTKLVQIIKGKPTGVGLKYYCICCPITGYLYMGMLHSSTEVPHQKVWGRIVAICYKLLSGDPEKKLKSFLDQGYWVYKFFLGKPILKLEFNKNNFYLQIFTDRYYCSGGPKSGTLPADTAHPYHRPQCR